jgi:hypothetical protein
MDELSLVLGPILIALPAAIVSDVKLRAGVGCAIQLRQAWYGNIDEDIPASSVANDVDVLLAGLE